MALLFGSGNVNESMGAQLANIMNMLIGLIHKVER
jgi:hypothetical protein